MWFFWGWGSRVWSEARRVLVEDVVPVGMKCTGKEYGPCGDGIGNSSKVKVS